MSMLYEVSYYTTIVIIFCLYLGSLIFGIFIALKLLIFRSLNVSTVFLISINSIFIYFSIFFFYINISNKSIGSALLFAAPITFIILTLIYFLINKKYVINNNFLKNSRKLGTDILLSIVISAIIFFIQFFYWTAKYDPISLIKFSGDGPRIIQLILNISKLDQGLFSLTHFGPSGEEVTGLFYPWAGLIASSILFEINNFSLINSLNATVLVFSFFFYPLLLSSSSIILTGKFRTLILILVILMTDLPYKLIFTNNFSQLISIFACISLFNLYILFTQSVNPRWKLIFMSISVVFLIPFHPASAYTFLILVFSYEVLFKINTANRFNLKASPEVYKRLSVHLDARKYFLIVFIFFLLLIALGLYYFSRTRYFQFISYFIREFLTTLPSHQSWDEFLSNKSVVERIIGFAYENIFSLALYPVQAPIALFLLSYIIYKLSKYKVSIYQFTPILFFVFLILSSSVSGIQANIKFISFLSTPYYQSPARITHLGVLLLFLYINYISKRNHAYKENESRRVD